MFPFVHHSTQLQLLLTCMLPAPGSRFLTREFNGLPCFAGKPAEASLARLASLPAISAVCPVSRVCELKNVLPNLLPYPRFRWSASFRGYTSLFPVPGTCFLTRDFSCLPHFAGKPAEASPANLDPSPAIVDFPRFCCRIITRKYAKDDIHEETILQAMGSIRIQL